MNRKVNGWLIFAAIVLCSAFCFTIVVGEEEEEAAAEFDLSEWTSANAEFDADDNGIVHPTLRCGQNCGSPTDPCPTDFEIKLECQDECMFDCSDQPGDCRNRWTYHCTSAGFISCHYFCL